MEGDCWEEIESKKQRKKKIVLPTRELKVV